ncbi:MAG: FAD:protein FMN transferase [Candidatus Saganbacteria bacterium]|nr:FAD:protein FMN transferase [Candidatus Saganbacteria bacterium]
MKNKRIWIIFLLLIALFVFLYFRHNQVVHIKTSAMHTTLEITVYGPGAEEKTNAAKALIEDLSSQFNWFDHQTDIGAINSLSGKAGVTASPDLFELLKMAQAGSIQTKGAFDVTTEPLIDLWKKAKETGTLPTPTQIQSAKKMVSDHFLSLSQKNRLVKLTKEGTAINLGGIAKGFAVQKAMDLLKQKGAAGALISMGSSIGVVGKKPDGKPWKIGVKHPRNPYKLLGTIILESGQSLSTSGDYAQGYTINNKYFSHLIDPRSGYPANGCQSVTVISNNATLADLYSTAIFVMGPWEGFRFAGSLNGVKVLIVKADGNLITSSGLNFEREEN